MSGVVVDVFGDINVDGSGQPWEYMDGWAYRVDGSGLDGTTFAIGNWFFSGPNALGGEATNVCGDAANVANCDPGGVPGDGTPPYSCANDLDQVPSIRKGR